jgi:hypothetical protein
MLYIYALHPFIQNAYHKAEMYKLPINLAIKHLSGAEEGRGSLKAENRVLPNFLYTYVYWYESAIEEKSRFSL